MAKVTEAEVFDLIDAVYDLSNRAEDAPIKDLVNAAAVQLFDVIKVLAFQNAIREHRDRTAAATSDGEK